MIGSDHRHVKPRVRVGLHIFGGSLRLEGTDDPDSL